MGRFFAKAINLQPELRFQTAGEMADALAALQLHWRRAAVHNQAVNHATEFKEIEPPRSKPANVCGQSARKLFGLNELFHSSGGRNQFSIKKGEKIIADKSAGLLWQQRGASTPCPGLRQSLTLQISIKKIRWQEKLAPSHGQ